MSQRVCFVGGARVRQPLESSQRAKFTALAGIGAIFVVGFAPGARPRRFFDQAHFYLLPEMPLRALRYLEMWIGGTLIASWLVLRHGVRLIVAQGPYEGCAGAMVKTVAGWFGCRVCLVVEAHGDFAGSVFLERRIRFVKLQRLLMRWAARFSLRRADVLRAVSSSTRAQLTRWAPGKPVVQFPAWTDMEAFRRAARQAPQRSGGQVLYAGVLTPLKGLHLLINAFSAIAQRFPDSRLVIVGRAENQGYAVELRRQVASLALGSRIEFRAPVTQAELATLMAGSMVVVLPSASEGLGRVLIEAMASATPVIGTCVGGIPDIIENGVNGFLVPPNDAAALAQRLGWLLENPHQARAMGEAGEVFAGAFFSTEIYLDGYRKVFRYGQSEGEARRYAIADL